MGRKTISHYFLTFLHYNKRVEYTNYSTKDYYKEFWKELAAQSEPTINDAVALMREKGNAGWVEADPYMSNEKMKETHFEDRPFFHEIMHIAAASGHTPFQEGFNGPMTVGFKSGYARDADYSANYFRNELKAFEHDKRGIYGDNYEKIREKQSYQMRDAVIGFAAGMYLYQKASYFTRSDFHAKSYDEKLQEFETYSKDETFLYGGQCFMPSVIEEKGMGELPASFLQLSRKEWRSIIAVATGLYDAKDTPYPKRLQPIQELMKHSRIINHYKGAPTTGSHAETILENRAEANIEGQPLHGWDGAARR